MKDKVGNLIYVVLFGLVIILFAGDIRLSRKLDSRLEVTPREVSKIAKEILSLLKQRQALDLEMIEILRDMKADRHSP